MTPSRSSRILGAVAASLCLAVLGIAMAQPATASTKTYSCKPPEYPNANPGGYFTGLHAAPNFRASGYSSRSKACKSGRSLILAYYKCRVAAGGRKGSCNGKTVNGLKCTEKRIADLQTNMSVEADVTCKKGSKKVTHHWLQNLV